ncbi:hypothetical protein ACFQDG_01235 [Natronoarchaeum mannanilyticum]
MTDELLGVLTAIGDGALLQSLPGSVVDPIIEQAETRDELNKALRGLDVERSFDEGQPMFRVEESHYVTLPGDSDE